MLNAWWTTTTLILGVILGIATAAVILLAFLTLVNKAYLTVRYSRPAWWLRRHRPTRTAP